MVTMIAEKYRAKRRRLRFNLAGLFLATLVCAVVFSFVARIAHVRRYEREAIELIAQYGGSVGLHRRLFIDRVVEVRFKPAPDTARALETLLPAKWHLHDAELMLLVPVLTKLSDLQTLHIESDALTDEGLLAVKSLKQLEVLDLNCPLVTSASTDQLEAAIPNLRILDD